MRTVYAFEARAVCPVDDETIKFSVTIEVEGMIKVEDIHRHSAALTDKPIMQEPYTHELAALFDARVTTIGTHSGVKITCSA